MVHVTNHVGQQSALMLFIPDAAAPTPISRFNMIRRFFLCQAIAHSGGKRTVIEKLTSLLQIRLPLQAAPHR